MTRGELCVACGRRIHSDNHHCRERGYPDEPEENLVELRGGERNDEKLADGFDLLNLAGDAGLN